MEKPKKITFVNDKALKMKRFSLCNAKMKLTDLFSEQSDSLISINRLCLHR